MTCPSCGSSAPADARFCPACGHSLVARPDERRVATVLFADLVGFTSMSETADPEHIKNFVDGCFERLAVEVTTFGGQVDKVIGDAMVALFGAPVAHEDDAERAVRAALRMQERLAEMRAESGDDVHLRIGVNTGEVLVGALRAGGDYTAMGDVVNTASRLQAAAGPDQVIVGPATHAAARRAVRYEPLGPIAVRGREEPVPAWLAVGAVAPPGHRHGRAETPLIGRDTEVTVLRAALATATTRKRAHLVLVTGEAGVGKSRLAAELGRIAECEQGARVLTGQCIPYGETNEWWPIATMVATAAQVDLTDPEATVPLCTRSTVQRVLGLDDGDPEIARITEGLLYLMREGGPGEGVDPTRAREDSLRAVLTFFAGLAAEQPLVLLLSDLHWGDDMVLEFLPRLLAHLATSPVVLVGTTRPELTDRWSPPAGRHNTVHVNLDALETQETDELLRVLLPDADRELLETLRDRSGGNPFFIEELVAMLEETQSGVDGARELPLTLHGLLAARLDCLEAEDRTVLEDAAVIGNTGSLDLVRSLAALRDGDADADADVALARLAERDFIELDVDEYRFRNELTREVAYGTLTKAERARRHGTLAKLIAQDAEATDRIDEMLDRLAYHYNVAASLMDELGSVPDLPSGMNVGAVKFLRRAAEQAESRDDWVTAERYISHAIPLVDADDRVAQLPLRLARARARSELRDTAGARRDLGLVQGTAEELGDAATLAAATTVLGDVEYKEGNLEGSARTLDDAIARWREIGDPRGLGDALRFRGLTDLFRGELDGASQYIGESLVHFKSIDHQRGEAWALQNLAWISFVRGHAEEAEARLDASATAFGELRDWGGMSWALGLLAWVKFTQGKLDEAEVIAERILQEATELGNRWAAAIMRVLLANVNIWRGEPSIALDYTTHAREMFVELNDAWGELQALGPMILALNASLRSTEAKALVDVMDEVGQRVSDSAMRQIPTVLRVAIAVQSGDPAGFEVGKHMADENDETFMGGEQRTLWGLIQLQHGDVADAVETLRASRAAAPSRGPAAAASVAYATALVAAGDADTALTVCDEAEDLVVTFVDRYRLELARAFALHRTGDADGARAAFDRAASIVDPTTSPLDQFVVRLARAAYGSATSGDGSVPVLEQRSIGWERTFALMAGTPG
jgi:class 3 adenylate cyclase/tetratricopeptide (TPR) repeat protein